MLGMGVTKSISFVPLFSVFRMIKTPNECNVYIYLMVATVAQLWWHLANMNVNVLTLQGYNTKKAFRKNPKSPTGKLTLNVRGPSYLGSTRSISWLLMPWLLTSPGHQQPWYWLCTWCRIERFLSYLRKDFNYLRHINVEKWHKI